MALSSRPLYTRPTCMCRCTPTPSCRKRERARRAITSANAPDRGSPNHINYPSLQLCLPCLADPLDKPCPAGPKCPLCGGTCPCPAGLPPVKTPVPHGRCSDLDRCGRDRTLMPIVYAPPHSLREHTCQKSATTLPDRTVTTPTRSSLRSRRTLQSTWTPSLSSSTCRASCLA